MLFEKNATISIVSNASMEEEEKIEVVSPGKFLKKEDCYTVIYEETEISGMAGTTTTVNIYENKVVLVREGSTSTKMEFDKENPAISLYNTPYGMLELTICTNLLNIDINENGGLVKIEYDMAISGQMPVNTSLTMKIKIK